MATPLTAEALKPELTTLRSMCDEGIITDDDFVQAAIARYQHPRGHARRNERTTHAHTCERRQTDKQTDK